VRSDRDAPVVDVAQLGADLHRRGGVGELRDRPPRLHGVADLKLAALPRMLRDRDDTVARRDDDELADRAVC
jgi:hypothetical protein